MAGPKMPQPVGSDDEPTGGLQDLAPIEESTPEPRTSGSSSRGGMPQPLKQAEALSEYSKGLPPPITFDRAFDAAPIRPERIQDNTFWPSIIQAEKPPSLLDSLPALTQTLKQWEQTDGFPTINKTFKAVSDYLVTPEYAGLMGNYFKSITEASEGYDPTLAQVKFAPFTEIWDAVHEKYPTTEVNWENPSGAFEQQPNVGVFFSEAQGILPTGLKDLMLGFFSSVPVETGEAAWIKGIKTGIFNMKSENPREQVAADATAYLRGLQKEAADNGWSSIPEARLRDLIVYTLLRSQGRIDEVTSDQGFFGSAGAVLDIPVNRVQQDLNVFINSFHPPDDLDRGHFSPGKNLAMLWGATPSYSTPSLQGDIARSTFAGAAAISEVAEGAAVPVVVAGNILGATANYVDTVATGESGLPGSMRLEGVMADPELISPIFDALAQGSDYELISGAFDASTYIWADPINYLAGVGFGMKAAKAIPRAAGVSKGRALMQSVVPFYGAHQLSVPYGITSRITYSLMSKTVDGMVDGMRASRGGTRLFNTIKRADTIEDVMRSVRSLEDSPRLAAILWDASRQDDTEFFWETMRGAMHGWNNTNNPARFDQLRGMVAARQENLVQAARRNLDSGTVGIRDVIHGAFGVEESNPFVVVRGAGAAVDTRADDFIDVDTMRRMERLSGQAQGGTSAGVFPVKGGSVEIRDLGRGTYAAFENGEFRGAVENVSSPNRLVGVPEEHRRRGIGTLLRNIEGTPKPALSQSGSAKLAFGESGNPQVLRISPEVGDGQRKAVISRRLGWSEIDLTDDQLVGWLADNGHSDFAAKLQTAQEGAGGTLFDVALSSLEDSEIALLRQYADNVADLDGIRFGDEVFISNRGNGKILYGTDLEEYGPRDLTRVMGKELYQEAYAHSVSQMLGNKSHTLTLVHRMPRAKMSANIAKPLRRWVATNSKGRTSQFMRRFKSGLATPLPTNVNFNDVAGGGAEFRNFMRLLGTQKPVMDDIMERWWRADSVEMRHRVFINAMKEIGENIEHPHIRYGLLDWANTHGVFGYMKTKAGKEVGTAEDAQGYITTKPVIKAWMETGIDLPNVLNLQRELRRYRWGSRHPRLISGFGQTNRNRKALAETYEDHIRRKFGAKVLEGIDRDDMMAMAYADVLGFKGRDDGLGTVNKMTSIGTRAYAFGQYGFTLGQLAFRPFAWSARVNLEEHTRAWMMGIPTIVRNPAQYGVGWWDAHFFRIKSKTLEEQRRAATLSARTLFPAGIDAEQALKIAEEVLPGITQRAKQSQVLDITDPLSVQQFYSHQLAKSLTGGYQSLSVESRQNIAARTVFKAKQLKAKQDRLREIYGTTQSWDILDDVPEIINKSSTFMFADETVSSIKDLDWVPNIRPRSIPTYAHAYSKKLQQIVNDYAGRFAVQRMAEKMAGGIVTRSAEDFMRTAYWRDVALNVEDVARARGLQFADEAGLVNFYLDTILEEELIGSLMRPMWTRFDDAGDGFTDIAEKRRLIGELAANQPLTPTAGGRSHRLRTGNKDYAAAKGDYASYFQDVFQDRNFEFPTVSGFFNPLYANSDLPNPFRRATNWALQTFGEGVTQRLHRQPAYLMERRRWRNTLKGMGWDDADANAYAHQKAFEMVNYTFFNNQHTGVIAHRLNKAIPFFSAWAEVISTWAWKIPSQNYLPLGYARMVHRMDTIMDGFVKMGLVEFSEDGQWYMQLEDDPAGASPLGKGLSKAMKSWVETPVMIIEQAVNLARWAGSQFDDADYKPADFSAWRKDNYTLAIGSPTRINTHGIMGVNQFQFGLAPPLNYAATEAMKRIPFAGDTTLVQGESLADIYEQLPSTVAIGQFLETNKRVLKEKFGPDLYNTLMMGNGYVADPEVYDVKGLSFQIPGSSWSDGVIDDLFFPFGHVESMWGPIRAIVPSSLGYVLRSSLGIFSDESPAVEGIMAAVTGTGTMEQYQIDSEIAKQLLHLEVTDGLISRSRYLANEAMRLVRLSGYDTVEEFEQAITPGSPESVRYTELMDDLRSTDAEAMKRATDNAYFALQARGWMGFFAPATPRMFWEEQKIQSQWYTGREMAEAAAARGSIDWATAVNDADISSEEDLRRLMGIIDTWAQDPTGDYAKSWFLDQYPSLMAWTTGTTYWGPAGPPGQVEDLDQFFQAYEAGDRKVLPPDVLMQKTARAGVQGSFESSLIQRYGNDPVAQVQGILTGGNEYYDMRDSYRMKLKGLDMWDAELNDGAYHDWRNRNQEENSVLLEETEEAYYELVDVGNEFQALAAISPELSDEDRKQFNATIGILTRSYGDSLREVKAKLQQVDGEWRSPREQLLFENLQNVMVPYWEGRSELFGKLDTAETREEQSYWWEQIRDLENVAHNTRYTLTYEGREFEVPSPLEQQWQRLEPEEQQGQIFRWIGRKPSWLNLFATNKLVEYSPQVEGYVPQTMQEAQIYFDATALKNETIATSRANPELWTSYQRDKRLSEIDERVVYDLEEQGRYGEAVWADAWPIERLVMSGTLPQELEQVAAWYKGIREELDAMEKGPGTEAGRARFLPFFDYLDTTYFPQHPEAEAALDSLGVKMFGEDGRYAVYARLYGVFVGEAD